MNLRAVRYSFVTDDSSNDEEKHSTVLEKGLKSAKKKAEQRSSLHFQTTAGQPRLTLDIFLPSLRA